jgi:hypothetical protein
VGIFCFCGGGSFPVRFLLYLLLSSMFLMVFNFVSFALFVTGYMCNQFSG